MKKIIYLFLLIFYYSNANAQNDVTGTWSSVYNADMTPVACTNMPDGRIMAWSANDRFNFQGDIGLNSGRTYTTIFDPADNSFTTTLMTNTEHDMFCPGTANIANGEVVITGGSSSPRTTIYNPITNTFRAGPNMNARRGYHAMTTLTDGRVFTVGGSWSGGRFNRKAEVWSEASGWVVLDNVDSENTVTQGAYDSEGIYRNDNHAWLWAVPGGRVFQAGPGTNMHWISTTGQGSVTDAGLRGSSKFAINGNSVMYEPGKILTNGGAETYHQTTPATNETHVIDITGGNANVTQVGNMNVERTFGNSVVLPNGEVLTLGGQRDSAPFTDNTANLTAEIWNPGTLNWSPVANMQVPRTYHSVAILMQDGRVWTAGGGLCGGCAANHPDAQIFTPPYLYNGNGAANRPNISSTPSTVAYSSTINVTASSGIDEFVLMRLSSATHAINNEQRRVPVTFSGGGNNYNVNIPNSDWLPPGYYWLFAMDNGVPSVGKTIQIGAADGGGEQQIVDNGIYYLESLPTGQHLSSPAFDNDNVRMADQGNDDDQKWEISHIGNNVYTLKNLRSNRYLNVTGAGCFNGANIVTWTSPNDENSRWVISKVGGEYFFRPVHCSSHALDNGGGASNNAHAWAYSAGNDNQRFIFKSTGGGGGGDGDGLNATYYNNIDFTGSAITRVDATIDFNWGTGSPDGAIGSDTYSARWEGFVEAPNSGNYTFFVTGDDGIRLWVNNQLIVDKWIDQGPTEHAGSISLSAGQKVPIRMEYYERGGGAVAQLRWQGPGVGKQIIPNNHLFTNGGNNNGGNGDGLNVTYYNNIDFTGSAITRVDATIDFNWGTGSPDGAIGSDTYSARWEGSIEAPTSGTYTFFTNTDDGTRLWVNNQLIVDKWIDQGSTEHAGSISLSAGQKVPIRMEYYENGGGAVAQLRWQGPGVEKQIIPQNYLFTSGGGITPPNPSNNRLIVNGTYLIQSKASGENAISPSWDNFNVRRFASGTVYPDHQWVVEHIGGGKHTIRNVHTNRYLEAYGGGCNDGANVFTYVVANADHHRWYIELINGDYFLIPAHCTSHAMDKNGGNDVNIHLWIYDTSNSNQKWDLIPQNGSVIPRDELIEKDLRATPILGQQTQLNWSVTQVQSKQATQYTFQYYHEEYENFEDIEVIAATDYMGLEQYDFVHKNPKQGDNYYQVKIDFEDGSVDYSNFKLVVFEPDAADIHIAPNPARDELRIDLANYMDEPIHYFVSSITGQVILHGNYKQNHSQIESVDLMDFANGTYIIYLRPSQGKEVTKKFVVLKNR